MTNYRAVNKITGESHGPFPFATLAALEIEQKRDPGNWSIVPFEGLSIADEIKTHAKELVASEPCPWCGNSLKDIETLMVKLEEIAKAGTDAAKLLGSLVKGATNAK